jgi:hypothetical protein
MADQHRPLITRHGTHCICGVFCAAGRDIEGWRSHARDRVLLDGTACIMSSPIGESWWLMMQTVTKAAQAYVTVGRKVTQALAVAMKEAKES